MRAYLGNKPYIFVSYAHKDFDIVSKFIELLQEKYNVWFDEGIKYGNEWENEIINKLEKCSLFLFLITNNSLESINCRDEIFYARENKLNFINIIFEKDLVLPKDFNFRYGRYQQCLIYKFNNYEECIDDLYAKQPEWFGIVKKDNNDVNSSNKIEETLVINQLDVKTYKRIGDKIYFGTYPQTRVEDEALISELNRGIILPTASNDNHWDCYWDYYINGETKRYMFFIDRMYNNKKYRGVYFTKYRPFSCLKKGELFNHTQKRNGYKTREIYWFSYDLIEWNIIREEDGKALIISKSILDCHEYYPSDSKDIFEHDIYYLGLGYANNYQLSTIRAFLNVNFKLGAFSSEQLELIEPIEIETEDTSKNSEKDKKIIKDNVFLLSEKERYYLIDYDDNYGIDVVKAKGTDYAKCQGLCETEYYQTGSWFTRDTCGCDNNYVIDIGYNGEWSKYGSTECISGVRPACWINIKD